MSGVVPGAGEAEVRCWGVLELDVTGTEAAAVTFTHPEREAVAEPVSIGDRRLVRFSPDRVGRWHYSVTDPAGDVIGEGSRSCGPARPGDHGPLRVHGTRFAHADGTRHLSIGTTALWWHHQGEGDRAATLATLAASPFSTVRMSVLTEGATTWTDPDGLGAAESAVAELADLGLQAELVLFGTEAALRPGDPGWQQHLQRVVGRLAAFSNVSWCLSLDADRSGLGPQVWDEALRVLAELDHGRRLRTVHAGPGFDFGHRLISHSSVRDDMRWEAQDMVRTFAKPAVLDVGLEGDAPVPGGGLTAEEMVSLVWWAVCRGGHGWHGEEFVDASWSRHGGKLDGAATSRLAFLREVLAGAPAELARNPVERHTFTLEAPGEYYLQYHGLHRYSTHRFSLPEDGRFSVEVIDTWEMTVDRLPGTFGGEFVIELPRKPYVAVRISRC